MFATLHPAVSASASPPAAARRRMAATVAPSATRKSGATLERMRTISALLAAVALAAATATAATAAPARTAKLTPSEAKWASPVIALWNAMNAGLLVVGDQTTAKNALVPGSAANKKLVVTLANFIACTPVMNK